MNVRATIIAAGLGAAFFAAEYTWYYQPGLLDPDEISSMLRSDHRKARAAVSRILLEPRSAHFSGMRTVEADAARYVCGSVNATTKSGRHVDAAFVYTVAIDLARVDDGGRITSQQTAYKSCPTADDKIAEQQALIPPGVQAMSKVIGKAAPKAGGETMEQQLGQLAARTTAVAPAVAVAASSGPASAAAGSPAPEQRSGSRTEARIESKPTWLADQPPAAWPVFPAGHSLAKPTRKRTAAEALALATDVEGRWERSKSPGTSTKPPSPEEVSEACRALLTVDPTDQDYPKAWAAFVRLSNIDRQVTG